MLAAVSRVSGHVKPATELSLGRRRMQNVHLTMESKNIATTWYTYFNIDFVIPAHETQLDSWVVGREYRKIAVSLETRDGLSRNNLVRTSGFKSQEVYQIVKILGK